MRILNPVTNAANYRQCHWHRWQIYQQFTAVNEKIWGDMTTCVVGSGDKFAATVVIL
jgi:hypothetical protein